ncbi:MAG: 5-(carboxyamino)imidazole ribonucleotide mutase [Solobacterium sp.]|nr:5-(carboxyamino)imidazole ribonucleotide mutase [Solobacterium sp.]MBR3345549.1 5-(carboxyamino)imidazole ribonucleotide mutase [Solobacterium sp.]MDO4416595.1 5-(carboxyamino)imidazole ribonucleotide mutase [Erysipelotrichaceae bacterium]
MKKAAIIMGSDTDWGVMKKAAITLKELEVPFEVHVYSAHRTPEEAGAFAEKARENGFGVLIAGAGMSAALAGALAAKTTLPVIGVPLDADLDGMDSLLTTVMMPPGIPVASVGINGAKNAALLAAQILAVEDSTLEQKLAKQKQDMHDAVLEKDARMQEEVKGL